MKMIHEGETSRGDEEFKYKFYYDENSVQDCKLCFEIDQPNIVGTKWETLKLYGKTPFEVGSLIERWFFEVPEYIRKWNKECHTMISTFPSNCVMKPTDDMIFRLCSTYISRETLNERDFVVREVTVKILGEFHDDVTFFDMVKERFGVTGDCLSGPVSQAKINGRWVNFEDVR